MPRYRHRKKDRGAQSALPATSPAKVAPKPLSILGRSGGGPGITEEEFIRLMTGSAALADEPEFADLELDVEKTEEITERWMNKYGRRLEAAEKKGSDAFSVVYDEVRIKAIDQLFTPPLRAEVNGRLQRLIERLMVSKNKKKLELAVAIQAAMAEKKIPWGIIGLILAIYDRTLKRALKQMEEEAEFSRSVLEALGEEEVDINHLIDDPDQLEKVAEKISSARPEILQQANEYLDQIADAFESEVFYGRVVLDLFTEIELVLPFQRLEAEYGKPLGEFERSGATGEQVKEAIDTALMEIMTPERYQQFRRDLEKTGKIWLRKRHRWAAALDFEILSMDPVEFEVTSFVYAVFVGQLQRRSGGNR